MAKRSFDFLTLGGRVPWAVGLLLSVTVFLSLTAVFGNRNLGGFFETVALVPAEVWRGQLWRLAVWPFIEPGPLGLIFGCLMLYWFGGDLASEWGSRRFLRVFAGIILAAAIGTCLIARVDPHVLRQSYMGSWTLTTAMAVAWGLWFPHRVVRIYFVLPVSGLWMARITIGITIIFAIYFGWTQLLPELVAEASVLAWMFRKSILSRWSRVGRSFGAKGREAQRVKNMRKRGRVVVDYLRAVEPPDSKKNGSD